jgi:hypothetical protein
MIFVPGWVHRQAAGRGGSSYAWQPGWRGTGMMPPRRPPVTVFSRVISGVPLSGGQAQTVIGADGTATAKIGPQALGTSWYPASAVISTTTGAADNATAQCFLGSSGVANLLQGQSYAAGGDTIGLSVPQMTPGDLLIVKWAGGTPGDLATVNIVGTMDALAW